MKPAKRFRAPSETERTALAELSAPTVGVITGVGDAHLGGFGSRQRIADHHRVAFGQACVDLHLDVVVDARLHVA